MNVTDIKTPNWQISLSGIGNVEQGANDVNQAIAILLSTQKGSDPLRQDFGVDLLKWIDQPTNIAGPGLVSEIIDQVGAYETRVNLTNVSYYAPDERVIFGITWGYAEGQIAQPFTMAASKATTVYLLLTNESGFVLLSDDDVALILS